MQDNTRLIRLTNDSGFVLVDADSFDELRKYGWYLDSIGYAMAYDKIGNSRTKVRLHVVVNKTPKGRHRHFHTDHIDGNKRNNTRSNLRTCSYSQNMMNQKHQDRAKDSKFKGVCLDKRNGTWLAYIKQNGKRHHLGCFNHEISAAACYNHAAKERFGEFAKLNFLGAGVIRLSGVRSPCRQG